MYNKAMELKDFEEILNHLKTFSWDCDIQDEIIFEIAKNNFSELIKDKTQNKNMIRLVGQSGSGKTTQLMPSARAYFESKNMSPIRFAVRDFAVLHPHYSELLNKFGKEQIREKTNGFALRCLLMSVVFATESGYDILFEVTLLSKEFEDFIFNYLNKNKYKNLFLVLAVNKKVSDYFIEKRGKGIGSEAKRVVYKASSDYFENAVNEDIGYFSKNHGEERVIIWSAFEKKPVFDGYFKDAETIFFRTKKIASNDFQDEKSLCDAKISYLINDFKPD